MKKEFQPGDRVKIDDLKKAVQYNGKNGYIKEFKAEKGRYVVEVINSEEGACNTEKDKSAEERISGKSILVLPKNLKLLKDSAEREAERVFFSYNKCKAYSCRAPINI